MRMSVVSAEISIFAGKLEGTMKRFVIVMLMLAVVVSGMRGQSSGQNGGRSVEKSRKKVAVVLSGGGAKGMGHIGALKVIERAGIPVDIDRAVVLVDYVAILVTDGDGNIQSFIEIHNRLFMKFFISKEINCHGYRLALATYDAHAVLNIGIDLHRLCEHANNAIGIILQVFLGCLFVFV
jgi:hypothetical protein